MNEQEQLEAAIRAQEALRPTLGDAAVDAVVAVLKEKLASLRGADDQRKLATVLFADVSGFTAMSETMDAEDVRDTMNALWQRLDASIARHGGRIDKHIGDALMALFGVPVAREDDAERAVRAALEMQEALKAFAAETGRDLRMRIGINTGPVMVGAVATTAEFTAMGDAVNLASRLEHAAPVGGVLISHDAYRLVSGAFDATAQPPLTVKGKSEPVRTYLIERAKPRSQRSAPRGLGIETRMVGREAELRAIEDALAASARSLSVLTVAADAGLGKSRLLYEFLRRLPSGDRAPWVFKGRALRETERQPYGLLRDVFSTSFEIADSDGASVACEKLVRGVAAILKDDPAAEERAHFLGHLLGFDFSAGPHLSGVLADASQLRDRGLAAFQRLFTAAAAERAVVLALEDVHWADDRSLDALVRLAGAASGAPLFCLCLARPALYERRPDWGSGRPWHRRLDLKPLSRAESGGLVAELLARVESLPTALRDRVVEASDGNPFYVEEIVRMMIEDGVVAAEGDRWTVRAERLTGLKVPPTLTGVLQARLDGLTPAERKTAQRASVFGRVFWDDAVGALADAPDLPASLEALRGKEMVFQRPSSSFSGAKELIFKHALLRDVAYESVLKRERKAYHAAAGAWLAARAGERVGEWASVVAEHLERAGEGGKASRYLEEAGVKALGVGAFREAKSFLERALTDAEAGDDRREPLLRSLGLAHMGLAEYEEAGRRHGECLALAKARGDKAAMARALTSLCAVSRRRGAFPEARTQAEEALVLAFEADEAASKADALFQLGSASLDMREYAAAEPVLSQALAVNRELGNEAGMARCHNNLAVIASRCGDKAKAARLYRDADLCSRRAGDRAGAALATGNLGYILSSQGEVDEGRRLLLQALEFHEELGARLGMAHVNDSLAELAERSGDLPEAERRYRETLRLAAEIGGLPSLCLALAGLASVRLRRGPDPAALETLGMVLSHPSCSATARTRAEGVLARLGAFDRTAFERGRTLALEETARRELAAVSGTGGV